MAINFDQLPDKPAPSLIDKGKYLARIEKAEMKTPKANTTNKPDYLNLTLALKDETGNSKGKIFDIITESDSDYVRFKLKQLLQALNIKLKSFELKDLPKLIQGKDLWVDVTIDDKQDPPRNTVDIFTGQVYYPLNSSSFDNLIDASDAEDALSQPEEPVETEY